MFRPSPRQGLPQEWPALAARDLDAEQMDFIKNLDGHSLVVLSKLQLIFPAIPVYHLSAYAMTYEESIYGTSQGVPGKVYVAHEDFLDMLAAHLGVALHSEKNGKGSRTRDKLEQFMAWYNKQPST